jgi:hypothetical protein
MKRFQTLSSIAGLSICLIGMAAGQEFRPKLTISEECALRLVQQPVASKLKLSGAQRYAIKNAEAAYEQRAAKLTPKADPTGAKLDRATKAYADTCLNTLTAEQKSQLLEVGIPDIGIRALEDPVVSAKLKLSSSQETKIRGIIKAWVKVDDDYSAMIANAIIAIPEPKPGADRAAYEKKCEETLAAYQGERNRIAQQREDSEDKVFSLLSKSQQLDWAKLSGTHQHSGK